MGRYSLSESVWFQASFHLLPFWYFCPCHEVSSTQALISTGERLQENPGGLLSSFWKVSPSLWLCLMSRTLISMNWELGHLFPTEGCPDSLCTSSPSWGRDSGSRAGTITKLSFFVFLLSEVTLLCRLSSGAQKLLFHRFPSIPLLLVPTWGINLVPLTPCGLGTEFSKFFSFFLQNSWSFSEEIVVTLVRNIYLKSLNLTVSFLYYLWISRKYSNMLEILK